MTDRYTRTVLTVIAAALVVIAARGGIVPPALAAETLDCRISGPIDVKVDSAFSAPGSSSSSPMYVRQVQ